MRDRLSVCSCMCRRGDKMTLDLPRSRSETIVYPARSSDRAAKLKGAFLIVRAQWRAGARGRRMMKLNLMHTKCLRVCHSPQQTGYMERGKPVLQTSRDALKMHRDCSKHHSSLLYVMYEKSRVCSRRWKTSCSSAVRVAALPPTCYVEGPAEDAQKHVDGPCQTPISDQSFTNMNRLRSPACVLGSIALHADAICNHKGRVSTS